MHFSNTFFVIVIIGWTIGIVITIKNRRKFGNIYVNIIVPAGIYMVITYATILKVLLLVLGIIFLLIGGVYLYIVFTPKIKSIKNRRKIILKRVVHAFFGIRSILAAVMVLMFLYVGVIKLWDTTTMEDSSNRIFIKNDSTIEGNMDVIMNLYTPTWRKMSLSERIDTLQVIADIEATRFGIPYKLTVSIDNLPDYHSGYYSDNKIVINRKEINADSAMEAILVICHESFHAYQECLCEAYDNIPDEYKELMAVAKVEVYENEWNNYENGEENFDNYYNQTLEMDARAYEEEAEVRYAQYIENGE